ncbi:MAG: HAD hydrolase-like protein, partial [Planctomycetota bacterium]
TGGAGQLAFAETFAEEFQVPEICDSVSFAGRSDRAIACDLLEVHGHPADETNWRRFHRSYVDRLPDALKRREGRVLPGVADLLSSLRGREQVLLGLLTGNVRDGAQAKLAHYELVEEFAFGGFGDESTDRNDIAAAALREAERRISPGSSDSTTQLIGTMVIGDTVHDIRCARSIGALAVAVPTGGTPADLLQAEQPDLYVETLEDHAELLTLVDAALSDIDRD